MKLSQTLTAALLTLVAVSAQLVWAQATPPAPTPPAQTPPAHTPATQTPPQAPDETPGAADAAQPTPNVPPTARAQLQRLQTRLQNEPGDLNAWLDLGQLQLGLGRAETAKTSFLEAVGLDYLSADAHFGLGLSEYTRANFRAALFEFSEVTRLFPERFDGHFNRAVTLAQLRRGEEAVAAFQEALVQASPEAGREERADAQLGLAGQLELLGRFDEAAEAYTAAIGFRGRLPELLLARSTALYRAGRGLEALPTLTQLEAAGTDYQPSALIADIYLQANQTDYALNALARAQRRAAATGDPQVEADVLVQLGLLQRNLGRSQAAARSFGEAAALTPEPGRAFYNQGVSLLEGGEAQRALGPLQNALAAERAQGQVSGEVFLALATAYDQLGQPDAARRNADAAATRLKAPRLRLDAAAISGRALYRSGNLRGALIALLEVAEARPNDAQAQLWVGLAYYEQGDYTEAVSYYERATTLSPDNLDARLNLGAAYLAAKRYTDAENVYALITQQSAEDAEAFYNLGWSLYSQERGEEAQTAWTTASELGYEPAQAALTEYFE